MNKGGPSPRRGLVLAAAVLVIASALSFVYAARQARQARELAASRDQMSASLEKARREILALSEKIEGLRLAAQNPAPAAAAPKVAQRAAAARKAPARPPDDPRWKRIQSQLSDQEKELASTREELERAREELQGKLSSTRDELSTSIARNHDELVALQKRGERNYYEFQLNKSKQFQRVGPISLSLRKANTKRKSYDVAMVVDDFQLQKKNVNALEPVLINLSERPQPVELVVNQISKDHVAGYLSEPKFKKSELAAAVPGESKTTGGERQALKQ
jgi:hypothetical protein